MKKKNKYTVIETTKTKYSVQFEGWLTQGKMERLCDRLSIGHLLDYTHTEKGDMVSSQIGSKFKGDKLTWTIDPNLKHLKE